jgi:hypothetical protein
MRYNFGGNFPLPNHLPSFVNEHMKDGYSLVGASIEILSLAAILQRRVAVLSRLNVQKY